MKVKVEAKTNGVAKAKPDSTTSKPKKTEIKKKKKSPKNVAEKTPVNKNGKKKEANPLPQSKVQSEVAKPNGAPINGFTKSDNTATQVPAVSVIPQTKDISETMELVMNGEFNDVAKEHSSLLDGAPDASKPDLLFSSAIENCVSSCPLEASQEVCVSMMEHVSVNDDLDLDSRQNDDEVGPAVGLPESDARAEMEDLSQLQDSVDNASELRKRGEVMVIFRRRRSDEDLLTNSNVCPPASTRSAEASPLRPRRGKVEAEASTDVSGDIAAEPVRREARVRFRDSAIETTFYYDDPELVNYPLVRSASRTSTGSRENPFVPDGALSREVEQLISHMQVVRVENARIRVLFLDSPSPSTSSDSGSDCGLLIDSTSQQPSDCLQNNTGTDAVANGGTEQLQEGVDAKSPTKSPPVMAVGVEPKRNGKRKPQAKQLLVACDCDGRSTKAKALNSSRQPHDACAGSTKRCCIVM